MSSYQMKRTLTITITYEWFNEIGDLIKPEHVEALEETAEGCITEAYGKGAREGEMFDWIHMTEDDPEDGTPYRGWWKHTECKCTES